MSVLTPSPSASRYSPRFQNHTIRTRRLRHAATILSLALAPNLHAQSTPSPIQPSPIVPHHYLVVYRNATIPPDAETRALSAGARLTQRNPHFGIAAAQSLSTEDDATTMRRLAAQPNVAYVLHDRLVTAHHLRIQPISHSTFSVVLGAQAPYDTYYTLSPQGWAVQQVGGYGNNVPGGPANGPWSTTMGKGVRIAILDSGVDANHPDIAPNLALNLSEVNQSALPSACDDGTPQDQTGHGTWTASLAAAAIGPGTGQVIGVAPAATLLNIKVLERLPSLHRWQQHRRRKLHRWRSHRPSQLGHAGHRRRRHQPRRHHLPLARRHRRHEHRRRRRPQSRLRPGHLRRLPSRSHPHRRSWQRRLRPLQPPLHGDPRPIPRSPRHRSLHKSRLRSEHSPPKPPAPPAPSRSPTTATTALPSTLSPRPAAATPQAPTSPSADGSAGPAAPAIPTRPTARRQTPPTATAASTLATPPTFKP